MENLITCNICKKQKKLNEQKSLYYEGMEKEMAKNLVCEECYPRVSEEIENETKNINYVKPAIIGLITTILVTIAFYPIYAWIMNSESLLNILFVVALIPGGVVLTSILLSSGRKKGLGFMGMYLLYMIVSFVCLTAAYSLITIFQLMVKSANQLQFMQLVEYLIQNPQDELTELTKNFFSENFFSEFSILMLILFLLPTFIFMKRKLHKVI